MNLELQRVTDVATSKKIWEVTCTWCKEIDTDDVTGNIVKYRTSGGELIGSGLTPNEAVEDLRILLSKMHATHQEIIDYFN